MENSRHEFLGALILLLACSSCTVLFPATTVLLEPQQEALALAFASDVEGLLAYLVWILGVIGL